MLPVRRQKERRETLNAHAQPLKDFWPSSIESSIIHTHQHIEIQRKAARQLSIRLKSRLWDSCKGRKWRLRRGGGRGRRASEAEEQPSGRYPRHHGHKCMLLPRCDGRVSIVKR